MFSNVSKILLFFSQIFLATKRVQELLYNAPSICQGKWDFSQLWWNKYLSEEGEFLLNYCDTKYVRGKGTEVSCDDISSCQRKGNFTQLWWHNVCQGKGAEVNCDDISSCQRKGNCNQLWWWHQYMSGERGIYSTVLTQSSCQGKGNLNHLWWHKYMSGERGLQSTVMT